MRTSWKVGLATSAFEPVPWAMPRTYVVLPEPSSPVRRTTSPGRSRSPSSMPARSVSAGELVTSSSKVVVAGGLELGADHDDLVFGGHAADDMKAGVANRVLRPDADELRLLPAAQRLVELCAVSTRDGSRLDDAAHFGHRRKLLHLAHEPVGDVAAGEAQPVEAHSVLDQGNEPKGPPLA